MAGEKPGGGVHAGVCRDCGRGSLKRKGTLVLCPKDGKGLACEGVGKAGGGGLASEKGPAVALT